MTSLGKYVRVALLIAFLAAGCDSDPLASKEADDEATSLSKRREGKEGKENNRGRKNRTDDDPVEESPPEEGVPMTGLFDPFPAWPLCGRITEAPPPGWLADDDGCPAERWGKAAYSDGPISSTYGPRPLVSENHRYDFHRGLDLATPVGTPAFAVADGEVRIAGPHASYSDPLVQIRHFRPGATSCSSGGGCYHSNYLHMSGWTVSAGEQVTKGQLIGYTGESASGFEHLHFEIRDAPPNDVFSNWSRDAVHPLTFLPHPESHYSSNITLTVLDVDLATPTNPKPRIQIDMPSGDELDFNRIDVEVYENTGSLSRITQPGDTPTGTTPEGTGYLVNPSSFNYMVWNRMYSYKNSSSYPWSSFECGGAYESPYCGDLPSSYDGDIHMDAAAPGDPLVGQFNGVTVWPTHHNASSTTWTQTIRFDELVGPAAGNDLCLMVRAVDAAGNATSRISWGNCD